MLTITYNGYELDLTDASDLFWSLASTDLSNLSVREGGFNNTWQLNTSQQNREAFGFIDQPDSNLDAAYVFRPVNIYNDGCLVFTGLGRVTDVRLNKISLLVVDGVGGLSERLDALRASDVVLGDNNGDEASFRTVGDLLCFVMHGSGHAYGYAILGEYLPNIMWPWANLSRLVTLMLNQLGYRVNNTLQYPEETSTYIGGKYNYHNEARLDDGGQSRFARFVINDTSIDPAVQVLDWPSSPPYIVLPPFGVAQPGNQYNAATARFTVVANMVVKVRFKYKAKFTTNTGSAITVRIKTATRTLWRYFSDSDAGIIPVDLEADFDAYVTTADEYVSWEIESESDTTKYVQDLTDAFTYEVTVMDVMVETVTLRAITDLEPKDVVTEYLNRFGKLLSINEVERVVDIVPIAQLANRTNTVDWSGKQFTDKELLGDGPYESTFVYGDLALRNLYTNQGGIGTGVLVTQTTTGDLEREAYASPYHLYLDRLANPLPNTNGDGEASPLLANANAPQWQPAETGNAFFPFRQWTVYYPGDSYQLGVQVTVNGFEYWRSRVDSNTTAPSDSVPNLWLRIPYTDIWSGFETTNQIAQIVSQPIPESAKFPLGQYEILFGGESGIALTYNTAVFEPLHWQPLLNTYYLPLFTALNRPRVDKYLVKLNDSDIANIDFSRPVLINGSYYYIVLIDQYDIINQSPTPVVLLRLL